MSSIGSIGSGVGGYATLQRAQPPSKEELFKRADADGSGGVDASELQKMLAHRPGGTSSATEDSSAADFSQLDSDGSGSLDATELDAAMKALMPKPTSTVEFAQQRGGQDDDLFSRVDANGDGSIGSDELQALQDRMGIKDDDAMSRLDSDGNGALSAEECAAGRPQNGGQGPQGGMGMGGPGGPGGAGGMPPPQGGDGESTDATGSSSGTTYDPLDTNQDGVVSAQERAAGELKEAMQKLLEAADTNGDDSIDAAEATAMQDALAQVLQSATSSDGSSASGSASSSDQGNALQQQSTRLAELLVQQYASVDTHNGSGFASTGTQVNVTA
jgi:Ca2+-binding EF-hand superfamily protein